jgi:hypothetical protein
MVVRKLLNVAERFFADISLARYSHLNIMFQVQLIPQRINRPLTKT